MTKPISATELPQQQHGNTANNATLNQRVNNLLITPRSFRIGNKIVQVRLNELFDHLGIEQVILKGSTAKRLSQQQPVSHFPDLDFQIPCLDEKNSKIIAEKVGTFLKQVIESHQEPQNLYKVNNPQENNMVIGFGIPSTQQEELTHVDILCSPGKEFVYDTPESAKRIIINLKHHKATQEQPFTQSIIDLLTENGFMYFAENIKGGLLRLSKRIQEKNKNEKNFYLLQEKIPLKFVNESTDEAKLNIIYRALKGEYKTKHYFEKQNILWKHILETIGLLEPKNQKNTTNNQIKTTPETLQYIKESIQNIYKTRAKCDFNPNSEDNITMLVDACFVCYTTFQNFIKDINELITDIKESLNQLLEENICHIMGIQFATQEMVATALMKDPKFLMSAYQYDTNKQEINFFFGDILRLSNTEQENNHQTTNKEEPDQTKTKCNLILDFINNKETATAKILIHTIKPEQYSSPPPVTITTIQRIISNQIENNKLDEAIDIISSMTHLTPQNEFTNYIIQELTTGKLNYQKLKTNGNHNHSELFDNIIDFLRVKIALQENMLNLYNCVILKNINTEILTLFARTLNKGILSTTNEIIKLLENNNNTGISKKILNIKKTTIVINYQNTKNEIHKHENTLTISEMPEMSEGNLIIKIQKDGSILKIRSTPFTDSTVTINGETVITEIMRNKKHSIQINHPTESITHSFLKECSDIINNELKNILDQFTLKQINLDSENYQNLSSKNNTEDPISNFIKSYNFFGVKFFFTCNNKPNQYISVSFKIINKEVNEVTFDIDNEHKTFASILRNPNKSSNNDAQYNKVSTLPEYVFHAQKHNIKPINSNIEDEKPNTYGLIESAPGGESSFKWEGSCSIYGALGNGKLTARNEATIEFGDHFLSHTLLAVIGDLITKNPNHAFKPVIFNNSINLELGIEGFIDQFPFGDYHFFTGYIYPSGNMIGIFEIRDENQTDRYISQKGNFLLTNRALTNYDLWDEVQCGRNSFHQQPLQNGLSIVPHGKIIESIQLLVRDEKTKEIKLLCVCTEKICFLGSGFNEITANKASKEQANMAKTEYLFNESLLNESLFNNNQETYKKATYTHPKTNLEFTFTNPSSAETESVKKITKPPKNKSKPSSKQVKPQTQQMLNQKPEDSAIGFSAIGLTRNFVKNQKS